MKKLIILFLFLGSLPSAHAADERIIFLHHSTGWVIYGQGHVEDWFSAYNTAHGSSYFITERAYPDDPYPWENYPYDYWNLWVNAACRADQPGIHCLAQLAADYDVVIFKNCYPVSEIQEDTRPPDITSSRKTLGNYKLQYSAVRDKLRQYPNTLFIFWTGAPLNESETNPEQAARARQFADWVRKDMLAGGTYPNIRVFDYFDLTADSENVLREEYESSPSDSHPNNLAAEAVGPVFAKFIVDSAQSFFDGKAVCGNSVVEGDEECDDGVVNGKPCVPAEGQTCTYCTSSCTVKQVGVSHNYSFLYHLLLLVDKK